MEQNERTLVCAAVPLQKIPRPCSAPSPLPRPRTATGNVLPADNYLGPAMGKTTVYDNLKKLQYDLFRAEEKAKYVEAVKTDMDRKHRIYVENVMRVKGAHHPATKLCPLIGAFWFAAHCLWRLTIRAAACHVSNHAPACDVWDRVLQVS